MTESRERLLQAVLRATVLIALAMLVHTDVVVAENAGCMNNQCKNINVFRTCAILGDFVYKYESCLWCKPGGTTNGRCDATDARSCTRQSQRQRFKGITAALVCDCTTGVTWAERSATYTDDNWTDSAVNQYLCTGS